MDTEDESFLHKRISVIPLGFSKQSLQRRLEAYYSLIAPDVLANEVEWKNKFQLIYEKFGGSEKGEKALAAKLCKKYGNAVRLRLGEGIEGVEGGGGAAVSVNTNSETEKTLKKRNESWYDVGLLPNQHGSGDINFTSQHFDPISALSLDSSKIIAMNPYIQDSPFLDNVSKFTPYLPSCDPMKRDYVNHHQKRKHITNSNNTTSSQQTKRKKVQLFTSISEAYNSGPFSLLYNIQIQKQRIRIMIRYTDCIRSTLTGYLIAFDKHYNMILRDVDEVYTPTRVTKLYKDMDFSKAELELRRRTCIFVNDNDHENRRRKKEEKLLDNTTTTTSSSVIENQLQQVVVKVKQRHFQQLLVRGDNVVMVWRASSERSVWPKTSISPNRSIYEHPPSTAAVEGNSSGNYCSTSSISTRNNNMMVGTPGSLLLALQSQNKKKHNTNVHVNHNIKKRI